MTNKKKIALIIISIILVITCGVGVYLKLTNNQPIDTLPDDVITNQLEDENRELITDSDPVTIEYPEIDWEEPPVVTIYNPDADLNDDGHVDKGEWEQWVAENPADLNQDLYIEDWELKAIEEGKTTDDIDLEEIEKIKEKKMDEEAQEWSDSILDEYKNRDTSDGIPTEKYENSVTPID